MPKRTTTTIYYVGAEALLAANKGPAWYRAQKITPLVGLPPDRFYGRPDAAPAPIADLDKAIGGPWFASLWVTNNTGGTLMHDWTSDSDWQILIERLRRFRQLAPSNLQGLLLDLEYYPATAHQAGGPMDQGRAWLPHTRLRERADAFASALLGWTLGGYVTATEIKRLPGLASWLRRMAKHGTTWVCAEDFNGVSDPGAVTDVGAVYVPGFHTVAEARQHSRSWVYDADASFLKNR